MAMRLELTRRNILLVAIPLIGIAIVGYYKFATYFPHHLRVACNSVRAYGRYYYVPFDRVGACLLIDNHISISGDRIISFAGDFRVEYQRINRGSPVRSSDVLGRNEQWTLKSSSYTEHTFARRNSSEALTIYPPPGASALEYNIYDLRDGRLLILFASGNWKGGPPSYYGYAVVEPKT
jgi:hypothetical protein